MPFYLSLKIGTTDSCGRKRQVVESTVIEKIPLASDCEPFCICNSLLQIESSSRRSRDLSFVGNEASMARCSACRAKTDLKVNGLPICPKCANDHERIAQIAAPNALRKSDGSSDSGSRLSQAAHMGPGRKASTAI